MIRFLYRLLSGYTFAKTASSGDPNRIGKTIVRRAAHKALAKMLRF